MLIRAPTAAGTDARTTLHGGQLRPYGAPVARRFEAKSAGTPRIDMRGLGAGTVPEPTPQLWEVPTMSESMALVGLDVHQAQTVVAVADPISASDPSDGTVTVCTCSASSSRAPARGSLAVIAE